MPEKKKSGISEEKARRIAVGATVAGVLLVVFLIAVLIVQFVQIGVANKRISDYQSQIDEYNEMLEGDREDLAFWKTQPGLEYLASQQGWK